MEVDRLAAGELTYELRVRGVDPVGTVENLRKLLRQTLKAERSNPAHKYPPNPYTFEEDVKGVQETLELLNSLVSDFDESIHGGSYKKINTKIIHVEGRIKRIEYTQENEGIIIALVQTLSSIRESLATKIRQFEDSLAILQIGGIEMEPSEINAPTSTPIKSRGTESTSNETKILF